MALLVSGEGKTSLDDLFTTGTNYLHSRICPGRHLADASLWIAMASVLATLNISKSLDNNGKEITPEVAFTSGITRCLVPYFQC